MDWRQNGRYLIKYGLYDKLVKETLFLEILQHRVCWKFEILPDTFRTAYVFVIRLIRI